MLFLFVKIFRFYADTAIYLGYIIDYLPKCKSPHDQKTINIATICFGVKFRHSIRAVSGAPLSSSGLEEAL